MIGAVRCSFDNALVQSCDFLATGIWFSWPEYGFWRSIVSAENQPVVQIFYNSYDDKFSFKNFPY
ncbi:hypothetical protein DDT54_21480 [Brenneria nigrifluens DSM 30175 = ATCC 13028]|uniref:Uncharacterized protein n=1 Tax=Brenneria nigrifluens DSM 30175 = ATCC 13028 TaxID=1121120 RepID=A0A2U1UEM0_9GAMM|nr:hypothetical protein DDT54_21480 [Brenneria nigrifluens DSM 30175 = ATCC 13028]